MKSPPSSLLASPATHGSPPWTPSPGLCPAGEHSLTFPLCCSLSLYLCFLFSFPSSGLLAELSRLQEEHVQELDKEQDPLACEKTWRAPVPRLSSLERCSGMCQAEGAAGQHLGSAAGACQPSDPAAPQSHARSRFPLPLLFPLSLFGFALARSRSRAEGQRVRAGGRHRNEPRGFSSRVRLPSHRN